jgi:hypothetical protein
MRANRVFCPYMQINAAVYIVVCAFLVHNLLTS